MNKYHSQQGAVLIIALVMLLVLTILAVSSMNNARMQEKMSTSSVFHLVTFQLAESAVDEVLNDTDNFAKAFDATVNATAQIESADWNYGDNYGSSASADYIGQTPVTGFSIGGDGVVAHHFRITGSGSLNVAGDTSKIVASSSVEQGVSWIGPAGGE